MSPRVKGNIAFAAAGLCSIYALGGFIGTATVIFIGKKAVDYPPLYPFMAIGLTAATWYLLRYRKAMRRIEGGLCVRCGYDLRGSPERCPECGGVPAEKVEVKTEQLTEGP